MDACSIGKEHFWLISRFGLAHLRPYLARTPQQRSVCVGICSSHKVFRDFPIYCKGQAFARERIMIGWNVFFGKSSNIAPCARFFAFVFLR